LTAATVSGLDLGDCFGHSSSIHLSDSAGSAGQCIAKVACQAKPAGVATSCSGDGIGCSSYGGDFDRGFEFGGDFDRGFEFGGDFDRGFELGGDFDRGFELGGDFDRGFEFGGDFDRGFDRRPEPPRLPLSPRPPLTAAATVPRSDFGESGRDLGDCFGRSSSSSGGA
jgi:hypothetical protein